MCGERIPENRKDVCLSRCISRNVRQNRIDPFEEFRTIACPRTSGIKGKCLQLRGIPEGKNQEYITAFKGRSYIGVWSQRPGFFNVEYKPNVGKLDVKLPVFFKDGIVRERADYFKKNVENTWSRKYKMRTTATGENWLAALGDVEVNVEVESTNEERAYFKIGESADVSSVSSKGEVNLRQGAYKESLYSDRQIHPFLSKFNTYNIYGHEAGHMFGLDDEYQVENDYKLNGNLKFYDKESNSVETHNIGEFFNYEGESYVIYKVEADDIQDGIFGRKLVIGGVKYKCDVIPQEDEVILLNTTSHKRSNALPGTLTDHYDWTKDALGKDYANTHATMDDSRNLSSKTIMGNGTDVKKHHYVTFWKAMTEAIVRGCSDSSKAPSMMTDWEIVE